MKLFFVLLLFIPWSLKSQDMKKEITYESLSPNLVVDDVNKAVDYYVQYFGFVQIASVPETGSLNWAMVQAGPVTLMFQSLKSIQEDLPSLDITSQGSHGTFFIRMKGVDDLYQKVKDKVTIAGDMRTTFYGMKEFTIKDLNGYFLTFAEEI
jgi:uncharacterized glyoxalase superfamily protein PhnB